MKFFTDKNGLYNLEAVSAITANKDGNAVLHMNGGEYTLAAKFDDVAAVAAPQPAPAPAPDPEAK